MLSNVKPVLHLAVAAALAASPLADAARAQLQGPPTEAGAALPAGFEPSGAVWHAGREQMLVVGDEGLLAALSPAGALLATWTVPSDVEAVCVVDPSADRVHLAREQQGVICEFDLALGAVVRVFDVSSWFAGTGNDGMEALTFVPDAADPEGGVFWAGSSGDGTIHRFRLSVASSTTSNQVQHLASFVPSAQSALRGLETDAAAGVVYALYTDPPAVRVLDTATGGTLANWFVPATPTSAREEGLALRGCELWIAQDGGAGSQPHVAVYGGVDAFSACRTFEGVGSSVSHLFGGGQTLTLDLGPHAAGWVYLVVGSRRLGNPGIVEGDLVVPLVLDDYFLLTLTQASPPVLTGFLGLLDAQGRGTATIAVPPLFGPSGALVGKRLHHAAVAFDPALGWFAHASNPVALRFTL